MEQRILSNKKFIFSILVISAILFFLISFFSEATYDPGDGIRHYLISRYCWDHHDLMLYSWGKPFFTIISSPFSQFGLLGINIFNILCAVVSAYFTYKIAQLLNFKYALLAIPFLLFTPSYFPTINSGLTEPLFGLVLILSIYLCLTERFVWAAILVSFLPFVRTEGNLILPLFLLIFLYRKKFLQILFLGFGTLVYSVIGFFYYDDFFWIKNQNPYNGNNKDFYGSGELLHFVNNHNFIWGSALGILFLAGLIVVLKPLYKSVINKKVIENKLPEEIILIYGSFLIYFVAHSFMWWKGLANSLGLLRVLAGVIPCSALICLRGLNGIMLPAIQNKKWIEYSIIIVTLIWVIRSPFKHDYFPFKLDQEQALIKEAGDWYKESNYTQHKVYYLYPLLAHVLDVDPFNPDKVGELWGLYPSIKEWGIGAIPDSTIVFWDAHFGPNECRIPLDTIINDPNFELIKTFKPKAEFTTLGGYKFEVYVFMKLPKPKQLKEISTLSYDFEENKDLQNTITINEQQANSGIKSCELSPKNEYSATLKIPGDKIPLNASLLKFSTSYYKAQGDSTQALIVFSIDDINGKNITWESRVMKPENTDSKTKWQQINCQFSIPQNLTKNEFVSIYVWNKSKEKFFVDDFKLSFWQ